MIRTDYELLFFTLTNNENNRNLEISFFIGYSRYYKLVLKKTMGVNRFIYIYIYIR